MYALICEASRFISANSCSKSRCWQRIYVKWFTKVYLKVLPPRDLAILLQSIRRYQVVYNIIHIIKVTMLHNFIHDLKKRDYDSSGLEGNDLSSTYIYVLLKTFFSLFSQVSTASSQIYQYWPCFINQETSLKC